MSTGAPVLTLRPCTLKRAVAFVREVHRRLPKVSDRLWSVGVHAAGELVGVAVVGRPARVWDDGATLVVCRVAVREGFPNACSMLYGACSRAARAMGAENLLTYTHADESGTSLRAAGWIDGGLTRGGEWSRRGRSRGAAVDALPKRRWWAPWSRRAA